MANNNDSPPNWFWVVVAVAAFLFGLGIIIAAVKIGIDTAPEWLLSVGRILLIVLAVGGALIVIIFSAKWALRKAVEDIHALEKRFPKQLEQAKQRTPTLVAIAVLVSEAIIIITDKSFEGKTVATLVVSFVMLLGFGLANGLMVKAGRVPRAIGFGLWFVMLAILPTAVIIDRKWGARDFGKHLWSLPITTKIFFAVAAVVMLVMPVLMNRIKDAQYTAGAERG